MVLNRTVLADELLWEKASTIQYGKTVPLVIKVVSTNWQNDYAYKLVEYEALGIAEYWIVDFRALGAVRYICKSKQPTITVCQLIERDTRCSALSQVSRLESSLFPGLELTTDAIFQAAGW